MSTKSTKQLKPIPPLESKLKGADNWDEWKTAVEITLHENDMHQTLQERSEEEQNQQSAVEKEKCVKAYAFIWKSLSTTLVGQFAHIPQFNPSALWHALKRRYESGSVANKVSLTRQLYSQRMKRDEEVDALAGRIRAIESKMKLLNMAVVTSEFG